MLGLHPSYQRGKLEEDKLHDLEMRSSGFPFNNNLTESSRGRHIQDYLENDRRRKEEEEDLEEVQKALREAQAAVEAVLFSGQAVQLKRYPPFVVAMQANLVASHSLHHVIRNMGPSYWLDIYPKNPSGST
eukprot:CAMPEP_0196597308 /NCGR_PEP_ID=MMETSP1081-20130531/90724_1 /TAXON_ID=36882 /ORGANISM="Pyramimonas amylifera, Strain CCMP720" /LENGTH=130 /DNA_ID=CAMNT_0041922659 /DNA_START=27 /DNA_END=419 /DNA_ORIENTATION=+